MKITDTISVTIDSSLSNIHNSILNFVELAINEYLDNNKTSFAEQLNITSEFKLDKLIQFNLKNVNLIKAKTELTNLVEETNEQLSNAIVQENKSGEAIDSMERKYWEGMNEAYGSALFVLEREMNK